MNTTWKKIFRIIILFILLRTLLGVWMWWMPKIFQVTLPFSQDDLYKGVVRESNPWLEPWQRWDTLHYQAIAERGFKAFDTALFTPPLYPFLMRLFSPLFEGNTLASGLFISALAFLGCLICIYFLAHLELQDSEASWRAVIYISIFPTSFFFLAAYNESLFLLNTLLCFYFVKKSHWILAGFFAALAALTRIPGAFLLLPLLWSAKEAWDQGDKLAWLAPTINSIGILCFPLYTWLVLHASPFSIFQAQNKRGGSIDIPGKNIIEATKRIIEGRLVIENLTELAFTTLLIITAIFIWKKLPRVYGIYTTSLVVFFLARFGSPQPLISMNRYALEVFPVFVLLATIGNVEWKNRVIIYQSLLGLLFFSAQFAIWGWAG
jgi:hypothetical protein